MAKITVLGGTGYTGANIATEAVRRGHQVTSFSRSLPEQPIDGVQYETGSLLDDAVRQRAVADADVVVATLSPRGELETGLPEIYTRVGELAADRDARLIVVGGFSSLRPAEGAPRIADGDSIPEQYLAEARTLAGFVDQLQTSAPEKLDWVFVSPGAEYGSFNPGEAVGSYRVGGEIAFFDENGTSMISGEDYAKAIVDEVEQSAHHRAHISVAY